MHSRACACACAVVKCVSAAQPECMRVQPECMHTYVCVCVRARVCLRMPAIPHIRPPLKRLIEAQGPPPPHTHIHIHTQSHSHTSSLTSESASVSAAVKFTKPLSLSYVLSLGDHLCVCV